jgi:hypothetical protein
MTIAPAGAATPAPAASIRPFRMTTVPFVIRAPTTGTIVALVMA